MTQMRQMVPYSPTDSAASIQAKIGALSPDQQNWYKGAQQFVGSGGMTPGQQQVAQAIQGGRAWPGASNWGSQSRSAGPM
jgi:hypothetical protein